MARNIALILVSFALGAAVVALYFNNRESEERLDTSTESTREESNTKGTAKSSSTAKDSPNSTLEAFGKPRGASSRPATSRPQTAPKPQTPVVGKLGGKSGVFTAPAGWLAEPPANSMRLGQFSLPKVEGDSENGLVTIFHFPQAGGSTERNIVRWIGQLEGTTGKGSKPTYERNRQKSSGFDMEVVDVKGRFVAAVMPGETETHNKPDWRLIGAVIEAAGGSYFVKGTGPAKTMAKWEPEFPKFFSHVTEVLRSKGVSAR